MTRWFIGIGSNIEPRRNVPLILEALAEMVGEVVISPIVETEPVDMRSGNGFLNLAVCVPWSGSATELKSECVAIEERLGRDRGHAQSKYRDRTADLDLLFEIRDKEAIDIGVLPTESYMRPQVETLCGVLGILPMPKSPSIGIVLPMRHRPIGPDSDCLTMSTLERIDP